MQDSHPFRVAVLHSEAAASLQSFKVRACEIAFEGAQKAKKEA